MPAHSARALAVTITFATTTGSTRPAIVSSTVRELGVRTASLPVVLVTRGPGAQVPPALWKPDFPAWLVVDEKARSVPARFLDRAPQLAHVKSGRIQEVPGTHELAEDFLRRLK